MLVRSLEEEGGLVRPNKRFAFGLGDEAVDWKFG